MCTSKAHLVAAGGEAARVPCSVYWNRKLRKDGRRKLAPAPQSPQQLWHIVGTEINVMPK